MDRLDCDRMFVAVMETGSFVAAAARLGTSSGQASKLVSRLEADLGVRLLNRTTRAVAATEVGRAYYDRIRPLLDDFDLLDLAVRNASQAPRGLLRLTVPLTFGTMQLTRALGDFARSYPEISLDVQFTDRFVSLVDEGFDAAIRVGRTGEANLIVRRLCDVRMMVVAAPDYLARRGRPIRAEDVAGHEAILDTNQREPGQWRFLRAGAPIIVPVRGRLRLSNAEACLQAAEMGLGLALLPEFVVARALRAGRVEGLLAGEEDAPVGVHALYPPGRHLAHKVRVLVDFLADRYRGPVNWAAD